jgi:hypothetical protein
VTLEEYVTGLTQATSQEEMLQDSMVAIHQQEQGERFEAYVKKPPL